jgi:hypothetical protein
MFDLLHPHRPLFGSYSLTEYTPRQHKTIRDVSLQNPLLKLTISGEYNKMYQDLKPMLDDPTIDTSEKLQTLSAQSVAIVQDNIRQTTPHWNIYSPEAHAN